MPGMLKLLEASASWALLSVISLLKERKSIALERRRFY